MKKIISGLLFTWFLFMVVIHICLFQTGAWVIPTAAFAIILGLASFYWTFREFEAYLYKEDVQVVIQTDCALLSTKCLTCHNSARCVNNDIVCLNSRQIARVEDLSPLPKHCRYYKKIQTRHL